MDHKQTIRVVYTPLELKELLGIGKNETYKLIKSGVFPTVRIGKRIVIPKEPFLEWLNKGN